MKLTQIQKLYLSNFLTGLVFWYGIEKLFLIALLILLYWLWVSRKMPKVNEPATADTEFVG